MKRPLPWIPLWVDPWLFGSTRLELKLEQRAVWTDLLTLGAKDSGFIRANENVPYPLDQLAGLLRIPEPILKETIERCIETSKLERLPDGSLRIVNWDEYQLTGRYRRMLASPSQTLPLQREEKREEYSRVKGSACTEPTSAKEEIEEQKATRTTKKQHSPQSFEVQSRLLEIHDLKSEIKRRIKSAEKHPSRCFIDDGKSTPLDKLKEQLASVLSEEQEIEKLAAGPE